MFPLKNFHYAENFCIGFPTTSLIKMTEFMSKLLSDSKNSIIKKPGRNEYHEHNISFSHSSVSLPHNHSLHVLNEKPQSLPPLKQKCSLNPNISYRHIFINKC